MSKRFNNGSGFLTSRYLLALLAPLVITGAMQITWPLFEPNPISLYLLAVILCAWYGGLGPGLLCVAISFLLSDLFFVEPYSLLQFHKAGDLVRVVLFVVIGPSISLLSELMHREKRRAGINIETAKCAERLLREKESFANQIAELSPFVIVVFDVAMSRDVYISPDVVNLVGYTPKELQEMEDVFSVLGYPDDIPRARENLARLKQARNGEIIECEYRIRRRDGEWRWVATRGISFERDELGEVRQIVTASLDITERKRAEEALREREERYRIVSETASEAIITVDESSKILFVNPSAEHIFGYSAKEMLGEQLTMLMPEYLRHIHKAGLNRYVESSRKHISWIGTELPGLHKSGHEIPLEVSFGEAVKNGDHYFTGIARDITNRKRVEQALRQSEQDFRNLFEQAHDAIIVFEPQHEIVLDVNERACEVYGFTRSEFIGMSLETISKDVVRGKNEISKTQERGHYLNFETVQYRKDGTEMFLEVNASTIPYQGQLVILSINRDVTERKRIEEKLRQSESQLAEAQKLASVGSWNWEIQNQKNTWSEELYRICGLQSKATQPSYETFIQLVHPDDRAAVKETFKHTLQTKQPIDCYVRIIRPDGAERIIHSRGNTISDIDGIPIRMHGTVQDVTEHKQAEDALGEAERKYRSIFENAVEGIFQTTADGRFISANPALARMLGFDSPEELIRVRTNIADDHYVNPQSREEFKQSMEENGFVFNLELEAYRKDRSRIWISENVRAVRDEHGSILYYEGTAEDITDRKRAQEALTIFRNLIDQSSDAIEVLEPDTLRFLDCNATAHQVLGYTREEFLALTAFDIDPVIDHATLSRLAEVMENSGFVIFESVHRRKDGSTFPVEINTKNIRLERNYRLSVVRDITDRKRAEAALRDAERKYRDIFENAGEGIFQSTPDGKFLAGNPALAHMHGFASPEELIQGSPDIARQIYVDPTRREDFKRQLDEQGALRGFEHQVFRKDRSQIWISVNARAVRDEKGEIRYYEGTAQDITVRKRAEEALRGSEERYRDLVENSLDLICTHDLDGWLLSANRAAMELMGYSSGPYAGGTNFRQILAPEVRDQFDDYLKRIRTDCAASGLMLVETRSGEKRIWEYHCTLRTEGIAAPIVRGVARDITERKRAAEALRDSEARYRELFENARDAIYVQDLSGVYISVNRAAEKLCGYDRSEIIGKHFNYFIAPEYLPIVGVNMSKKMTDKGETAYEIEVLAKDGHRVPVELSSALIFKHGIPVGIQGIARDITERKRAERALRSYSRQLIKAQEAERQHIARELHDQIGQVLTAIRINLHTVGNSCETEESRSLIDQGIGLVDAAIDQVRDLSFELRPSLLDNLGLAAALRWYSDQYTQRTGIRTKSASNLPEGQIRLRQELETACFRIVQEALTNVVRHANAKNVFIDLKQLDHKIVLSIKDDGIGFKEPANGDVSSTRLGLRGMKERALALGGALNIKSAPAQGTEIRATFPTAS